MTLSADQILGLKLLGEHTGGSFDPWRLMGPAAATTRATILTLITGEKTVKSKAGVNALEKALHALHQPAGDCDAIRRKNFSKWAETQLA